MTTQRKTPTTPRYLTKTIRHQAKTDAFQAARLARMPIEPGWHAHANAKGFRIISRVRDRFHLSLRCAACGKAHDCKIFTLRTARPQCPHCQLKRLECDAQSAGLIHLRRDPTDRQYSYYRAPCGHEVRRQHGFVIRVADGQAGLRCETCQAETETTEARERGWKLIGPDPEVDANYRLYAHEAGCGHRQRIARVNMLSGRFDCGQCGVSWTAAPSHLYLMRFSLADRFDVVKLGYARDPESRLTYQLQIDRQMPCQILRTVTMPSGHDAIRAEKNLHRRLRRAHPGALVDPAVWADRINVRSEIYHKSLLPVLMDLLDEVQAKVARQNVAKRAA